MSRPSDDVKRRAKAGDPDAMYEVGVDCEENGDLKRARKWYERAAELDHPATAWLLHRSRRGLGDACSSNLGCRSELGEQKSGALSFACSRCPRPPGRFLICLA